MPRPSSYLPLKRLAWLAVAISFLAGSWAGAQTDYFWQAPAGGTGPWDTITPSWSLAAAGPATLAWPNTGAEVANFGNATGTVTIANGGIGVNAFGVKFTTTGYTITGDPLTLMGAGGIIDTTTVGATINSMISGGVGLTKNGTGTLTLGGTNNYTLGTTVNAGIIDLTNASGLGATSSSVTVASGAAIQIDGVTPVANPLILSGNGVANGGALRNLTGTNTWSGVITVAAGGARINADAGSQLNITTTLNANSSGHDLTVGGAGNVTISQSINNLGTGALNKDGTGTLALTVSNSAWTGPVNVTGGGVISIPLSTSLGTTGLITLDNGTIKETNAGNAGSFVSATRNISLGAGGGTLYWDQPAGQPTFLIIVQTNTVISGVGGLTKAGSGIISVVTPATYQGPTHVAAGTLRVRTNNNVYPIGTALTVDNGAIFDLNGLNQQVGSLTGAGSVNTNAGTFTVGDSTSTTFSGVIGNTTGAGKVTKVGSGTLTLDGINTYTGATTINAGTLVVGSVAGNGAAIAGPLTAATGGTLGGNGTVAGAATVAAGGTVSPGTTTPGTLSFGSTLTLPGTYAWKLGTAGASDPTFSGLSTPPGAQTNHDALAATGLIDLTGSTLTLNSLGTTGFNNTLPYSWRIATGSGVTSVPTIGTISGANFSNLNGGTFSVANTGTALLLNFTPTPVPEPAFVLLACLGATGLAAIRRRRTS